MLKQSKVNSSVQCYLGKNSVNVPRIQSRLMPRREITTANVPQFRTVSSTPTFHLPYPNRLNSKKTDYVKTQINETPKISAIGKYCTTAQNLSNRKVSKPLGSIMIDSENETVKAPGMVSSKAELYRTSYVSESNWRLRETKSNKFKIEQPTNFPLRKESSTRSIADSSVRRSHNGSNRSQKWMDLKLEELREKKQMIAQRKAEAKERKLANEVARQIFAKESKATIINNLKELKMQRDYVTHGNFYKGYMTENSASTTTIKGALKTKTFEPYLMQCVEQKQNMKLPKTLFIKLADSFPQKESRVNLNAFIQHLKEQEEKATVFDNDTIRNEEYSKEKAALKQLHEVIAVLPKSFGYGDTIPRGIEVNEYTENLSYYKLDKVKLRKLLSGIGSSEVSLNLLKNAIAASGTVLEDEGEKQRYEGLLRGEKGLEKNRIEDYLNKLVVGISRRAVARVEREKRKKGWVAKKSTGNVSRKASQLSLKNYSKTSEAIKSDIGANNNTQKPKTARGNRGTENIRKDFTTNPDEFKQINIKGKAETNSEEEESLIAEDDLVEPPSAPDHEAPLYGPPIANESINEIKEMQYEIKASDEIRESGFEQIPEMAEEETARQKRHREKHKSNYNAKVDSSKRKKYFKHTKEQKSPSKKKQFDEQEKHASPQNAAGVFEDNPALFEEKSKKVQKKKPKVSSKEFPRLNKQKAHAFPQKNSDVVEDDDDNSVIFEDSPKNVVEIKKKPSARQFPKSSGRKNHISSQNVLEGETEFIAEGSDNDFAPFEAKNKNAHKIAEHSPKPAATSSPHRRKPESPINKGINSLSKKSKQQGVLHLVKSPKEYSEPTYNNEKDVLEEEEEEEIDAEGSKVIEEEEEQPEGDPVPVQRKLKAADPKNISLNRKLQKTVNRTTTFRKLVSPTSFAGKSYSGTVYKTVNKYPTQSNPQHLSSPTGNTNKTPQNDPLFSKNRKGYSKKDSGVNFRFEYDDVIEESPASKQVKEPEKFIESISTRKLSLSELKRNLETLQAQQKEPAKIMQKEQLKNLVAEQKPALTKKRPRRNTRTLDEDEQRLVDEYMRLIEQSEREAAEMKRKTEMEAKRKMIEQPTIEDKRIESTVGEDWEILKDMKDSNKIVELLKKRLDDPKRLAAIMERITRNEGVKNVVLQMSEAEVSKMKNCNAALYDFFANQNFPEFSKLKSRLSLTSMQKVEDLFDHSKEDLANKWAHLIISSGEPSSRKQKNSTISGELLREVKSGNRPLEDALRRLFGDNINYHMDSDGNELGPKERLELFNTHLLVSESVLSSRQEALKKLEQTHKSFLDKVKESSSAKDNILPMSKTIREKPLTACNRKYKVNLDVLRQRDYLNPLEILERRYEMIGDKKMKNPPPPKAAYKA